jgi:hypothetical protein
VRRVFASPRLENVERVAQILRDAGIQTRITHGRSYKGGLRGDFSYIDHTRSEPIPAVWVVRSEDQPAAREILRNSGLLDSTRVETGYSLPAFRSEEPAAVDEPGRKRAFRLKAGLLLAIAVVLALTFVSLRKPQRAMPATAAAPALPAGLSPTPDALAVAVLAGELPTRAGQSVCLSIDGHDPAPSLLALLPATPGTVLPASRCATHPESARLGVSGFQAPATGNRSGSIVLERRRNASAPPVRQTYDVSRAASGWRVIEPYLP